MKMKKITTSVLAAVTAISAFSAIPASAANGGTVDFGTEYKYVGIDLARAYCYKTSGTVTVSSGYLIWKNGTHSNASGSSTSKYTNYIDANLTNGHAHFVVYLGGVKCNLNW